MQLVAYGAQDIYLTGNPQITFFKVVYRRHTNFSMETIQQTINGTATIAGSATTGTVTISRNGDLVHKVYVTSKDTTAVTDGSKIVSEVEIERFDFVDGKKIKLYKSRIGRAEITLENNDATLHLFPNRSALDNN